MNSSSSVLRNDSPPPLEPAAASSTTTTVHRDQLPAPDAPKTVSNPNYIYKEVDVLGTRKEEDEREQNPIHDEPDQLRSPSSSKIPIRKQPDRKAKMSSVREKSKK
ncbi:unnamed protein product [Allacma fusca]|uniref:Uncharacterized protein n=1 Tax=Allacma fusca TaxID=39272 RepID=A0A8J2KLW9_9HEXA|nr:unnamed protein product [Allacma fusca]